MLDREAEIETRYGGGFVQSIEGVAGGTEDGRRLDWFFYVNGIESPVGSAERRVAGGDRIWWDHRDWTDAMRVPAVVGSWPEPFLQSSAGSTTASRSAGRVRGRQDAVRDGGRAPRRRGRERQRSAVRRPRRGRSHSRPRRPVERDRRRPGRRPDRATAPPRAASSRSSRSDAGVLLALDERAERGVALGAGRASWPPSGEGEAARDLGRHRRRRRRRPRSGRRALGLGLLRDRYAVVVGAGSDGDLPVPVMEAP